MDWSMLGQAILVLGVIFLGVRKGGIALGLWGGVGLLGLVVIFGVAPTSPPVDVMLIILAVIMAASVMESAGGIDFLVRIAETIIRKNPKYVTIVAPVVVWGFVVLSGTGHIVYPLYPVIYEVAHQNGIRPERPMAVSTIATLVAIPASPVSAATAAMIALLHTSAGPEWTIVDILKISMPATLAGLLVAAVVSIFLGKDLAKDPEYQRRLAAGEIPAPKPAEERATIPWTGPFSAGLFVLGILIIVLTGLFPSLRTIPGAEDPLSTPLTIQIVMLAIAAIMLTATKVDPAKVIATPTARAGITALVAIFGLAWLGDTFISANQETFLAAVGDLAAIAPWTFAIALALGAALLGSQAATTRAIMPLGFALGISPAGLIGMLPAVAGGFLLPISGLLIAAVNNDLSGTTRIGKWILNHSFMIPGLITVTSGVIVGQLLATLL